MMKQPTMLTKLYASHFSEHNSNVKAIYWMLLAAWTQFSPPFCQHQSVLSHKVQKFTAGLGKCDAILPFPFLLAPLFQEMFSPRCDIFLFLTISLSLSFGRLAYSSFRFPLPSDDIRWKPRRGYNFLMLFVCVCVMKTTCRSEWKVASWMWKCEMKNTPLRVFTEKGDKQRRKGDILQKEVRCTASE